jgi:voltage-gated potassium channel
MAEPRTTSFKALGYELFILLTSILSIANLAIVLLSPPSVAHDVALLMDVLLIPVFLFDFAYRLLTAPSRTRYFVRDWGWADMVAICPMLRVFRAFRMRAAVRRAREYGGRELIRELIVTRAGATFFITVFMTILVVEFAGMGVYYTERSAPGANIVNAGDAVWWGLVTITTVGYGDQYPVTAAGRIVGAFLLFAGIALFSVLTGFIANAFLAPRRVRGRMREATTIEAELDALRSLLADQEDRSAQIRAKLDDLEHALALATVPGAEGAGPAAPAAGPAAPVRPAG